MGADDLVAFGAQQCVRFPCLRDLIQPIHAFRSYEAGQLAYERYGNLLTYGLPFLRASGMQRVVDTAGNWSLGMCIPTHWSDAAHGDSGFIPSRNFGGSPHLPPHAPLPVQILSEEVNNTLNSHCPNAPHDKHWTDQWLHKFAPPIIKKLQKMAKGAKLEEEDVHRLVGVCIFETIAEASEQMRSAGIQKPKSKICDIFSPKEWKDWEYWGDVEKYYKTGYVPLQVLSFTSLTCMLI